MAPLVILGLAILVLAFLFSTLGLGGAMLYVPTFTWFGFDMKGVAIPTGLLLNGVTALSAAIYCLRAKMTDVRGAMPMVVTSLIAAPASAVQMRFVPTDILKILFSLRMLVAGAKMLLSSTAQEPTELLPFRKRAVLTGAVGLFIEFLVGLLGNRCPQGGLYPIAYIGSLFLSLIPCPPPRNSLFRHVGNFRKAPYIPTR